MPDSRFILDTTPPLTAKQIFGAPEVRPADRNQKRPSPSGRSNSFQKSTANLGWLCASTTWTARFNVRYTGTNRKSQHSPQPTTSRHVRCRPSAKNSFYANSRAMIATTNSDASSPPIQPRYPPSFRTPGPRSIQSGMKIASLNSRSVRNSVNLSQPSNSMGSTLGLKQLRKPAAGRTQSRENLPSAQQTRHCVSRPDTVSAKRAKQRTRTAMKKTPSNRSAWRYKYGIHAQNSRVR